MAYLVGNKAEAGRRGSAGPGLAHEACAGSAAAGDGGAPAVVGGLWREVCREAGVGCCVMCTGSSGGLWREACGEAGVGCWDKE